jgi:hypothetical protein
MFISNIGESPMHLVRCAAAAGGLVVLALVSSVPAALAGNPTVNIFPNPSAPGTSTTFTVDCESLTAAGPASSATLDGSSLGLPSQIPMQESSQEGMFQVTVVLPTSVAPGTYDPGINCSNGVSASGVLNVNAVPGQAPQTGDGTTSTATNTGLTDVGIGLLAAGSLAGGLVLRKRRSGSRI